jgi:hypothetical protein
VPGASVSIGAAPPSSIETVFGVIFPPGASDITAIVPRRAKPSASEASFTLFSFLEPWVAEGRAHPYGFSAHRIGRRT